MQKRFAILAVLLSLSLNAHADRYSEAARYQAVEGQALSCMYNLTMVKIRGGEVQARFVVPEVSRICGGILQGYLVNEAHWRKQDAKGESDDLARRVWAELAY